MANDIEITIRGKNDSAKAFTSVRTAAKALIGQLQQVGVQADQAFDRLGASARDSARAVARFDSELDDAHKAIGDLDDRVSDLDSELSDARVTIADLEDQLDQMGEAAKKAGDDTRKAGDKGGSAFDDFSFSIDWAIDKLKGLGPVGLATGAAVAAGIGVGMVALGKLRDAVQDATSRAMDQQDVGAKLGAMFGQPDDAARYGRLAGQIWSDNFGESVADAGEALAAIRRQGLDAGLDDAALKAVTEQAMTLSDVLGYDVTASARAVAQMLRNGIAPSAEAAFDAIAWGATHGVDKADDLLDTFNEYSTQFRKLGIDSRQALGLMSQGLQAGARDADTVADALKEFAIRARDGSTSSAAAFKAIGLDAKKMTDVFAAGGPPATAALDDVLDRIRSMKDPTAQEAAAVGLFGTKAEDLGSALYALDLTTATQDMGDMAGAADELGSAYDTLGNRIEGLKRKVQEAFEEEVGQRAIEVLDRLLDKLDEVWQVVGPVLGDQLDRLKKTWEDNRAELEMFADFCDQVLIPLLGATLVTAIMAVVVALQTMITFVGLVGAAWYDFKENLLLLAAVVAEQFARMTEAAAVAARAMGMDGLADDLDAAAGKLRGFAAEATAQLASIKDREIYINANATWALNAIARVKAAIASLPTQVGGGMASTYAKAYYDQAAGIAHAGGGPTSGGWTRMNEAGGELVKLPTGSVVVPAGQTRQMLTPATAATTTIINVYALDPRSAADAVRDAIGETVRISGPLPTGTVAA